MMYSYILMLWLSIGTTDSRLYRINNFTFVRFIKHLTTVISVNFTFDGPLRREGRLEGTRFVSQVGQIGL